MQNLIPLILIGFLMYFVFRKGGGMGCCGGHGTHETESHKRTHPKRSYPDDSAKIIDLNEDEYEVIDKEKKKASKVK